jgi:cysteine desulfurase/selenocysteine lyase
MNKYPRRSFIKKGIAGSLISLGGISNLKKKESRLLHLNGDTSWDKIREEFLLTKDRIYFNTAGLGASPLSVIEAYDTWSRKLETISETGHQHVKECRQTIAEFFNAQQEEIAITRNATEGVNIVAQGLDLQRGDEIILSNHEHVGGAVPWMNMVETKGIKIKLVELDLKGERNLDIIKAAISKRTKVLFVSHVTCTNGMVLPVKEIAAYGRSLGVITCIDGAQAAGMIDINLSDIDADFYVMSGHKWLFGPKGSGILFINNRSIIKLTPTFAGAYTTDKYDLPTLDYSYLSEASREEYGTRNTPHAMALKAAFDFHTSIGKDRIVNHGKDLASVLSEQLNELEGIQVLSPTKDPFRSSIVTFKSRHKTYQQLQKELSSYKCRVRGIYEADLQAIRISCALYNSKEEIDHLISSLEQITR